MHLRLIVMTNTIHSMMSSSSSSSSSLLSVADTTILHDDTLLSSFAGNPLMVGTVWMISSAIFTTYSTTKFIKYTNPLSQQSTTTNSGSNQIALLIRQQLIDRLRRLKQKLIRSKMSNNNNDDIAVQQRVPNSVPRTTPTTSNIPRHGGGSCSNTSTTTNRNRPNHPQQQYIQLSPSSRLTMYRFAGSLLFGLLFSTSTSSTTTATTTITTSFLNVLQQRFHDTITAIPTLLIPSICLFIANFSNTIALDRIGIGLTYTSKCGIPIITVLLTLLLDGVSALPNCATLVSLIPIAVGIAAASWSTPTFELLGFMMAAVSATAQSALNVTSKRALARANLSGPIGQRTMVAVGLLFTIIVNLMQIAMTIIRQRSVNDLSSSSSNTDNFQQYQNSRSSTVADVRPLWLTTMAMIAYHVEYLLSFIFVTLVGPITYGTCDAIRRLCIILFGRVFFGGDPLTNTNQIGIITAVLGALCYSVVSSKQ